MQGNPCYARLFADLTRMSPNPIIASGGQSRAPPVAGGARRKPSEQGSARKAPRADAARPLRTALRPPAPRRGFGSLSFARYDVPFPGRSLQCPCCVGLESPWRALAPLLLPWADQGMQGESPAGAWTAPLGCGHERQKPLEARPVAAIPVPWKRGFFFACASKRAHGAARGAPLVGPRGRPGQLPKKKGSTSWSMRGFQ